MHVCTQASPMRANSNPDDWVHPDATEVPGTYTDLRSMTELCGIPPEHARCAVATACPHCGGGGFLDVEPRGIIGGYDPELRDKRLVA